MASCGRLNLGQLRAAARKTTLQPAPSNQTQSRNNTITRKDRRKASLVLEEGTVFEGYSFGAPRSSTGETVFTTGMVGYVESLTDPSYKGELLSLTYPLIGNYGVPAKVKDEYGLDKYFESHRIHAEALIVGEYSSTYSHSNAVKSLSDWLAENDVPGIEGVDTRKLAKLLREKGSMLGKVVVEGADIKMADPKVENLVAKVSRKQVETYGDKNGVINIIAIDCGIKNNIIRRLAMPGIRVKVVPWNYNFMKEDWDGLFISNGPGDPETVTETIQNIRWALSQGKPVFGICLGHQLLALAAGGSTYKLKFGNRGQNQSVTDLTSSGRTYITPQNHGFAVDSSSLPQDWIPYFQNTNDNSNEGIIHKKLPFFSVQFHPEARGGPSDTDWLFEKFLTNVRQYKEGRISTSANIHPRNVIILGSGGLQIGQAGEFDYSGAQAIKALKEAHIQTTLVNPNIATVQTRRGLADKIYFCPVTAENVEKIIKQENADGILLGFGGQTGLNTGVELYERGVFGRLGVRVLGTPVDSIKKAEDRDLFAKALKEINEFIAESEAVTTVPDSLKIAERIGYPVIIRSAYSLGGLGSGFAHNPEELTELAGKALSTVPQILVEKSIKGWKEVEYEVVRDIHDNCITVCNMENFDPMGIHTGESIVVAPSQTLNNDEYHRLRGASIKIVRHLGIVGECNVQYALDPATGNYVVIEVNPRLSRSSALASKATGYPLAFVAAKLSLGDVSLHSIKNSITKMTTASFEPSLDYVVTKIPRWDLGKFEGQVSRLIGTSMKSVGEVMGIGRRWEESMQKAIRMVSPSFPGFEDLGMYKTRDDIERELANPTDMRLFAIAAAFEQGFSVAEIHNLTKITTWFLDKLKNIHDLRKEMAAVGKLSGIDKETMRYAKQIGFSDAQIAKAVKSTEAEVRDYRKKQGVLPCVKQIDTVAAEFPAFTNYLYMTYNGTESDVPKGRDAVVVLGSGVYRIGSSVEFDYCSVMALRELRRQGHQTVMINYNPETVSTDYDESDRLYFEELSLERVLDVHDFENPQGVIVSVGGQLPNMIALKLAKNNVAIMGTTAESIDRAEDRQKYSDMLDKLKIAQPAWTSVKSTDEARKFANDVQYPVLVRPSYVLSGAAMNVCYNEEQLESFLEEATEVSGEHPVVISKFMDGAKEIEVDAVAQNGVLVNWAVTEHVENAGVHSGDASLILPTVSVPAHIRKQVLDIAGKISKELNINGPLNTQYLFKDDQVWVIETNVRASRSFPFVSKVMDVDFLETATRVFLGKQVKPNPACDDMPQHYGVKASQFSFKRLHGADPILGVEMTSTGEVACFGRTVDEAFLKALESTHFRMPKRKTVLISGKVTDDFKSVPLLNKMGFTVYATPSAFDTVKQLGLEGVQPVSYLAALNKLKTSEIDLLFGISTREENANESKLRRSAVDYSTMVLSNEKLAELFVRSYHSTNEGKTLAILPYDHYCPTGVVNPARAKSSRK